MIEPILILIAIPLNFVGFMLKHKTKLSNKLIPVMLLAISWVVCFIIGKNFKMEIFHSLVLFTFLNGIVVTAVATNNWDFWHGIKTAIKNVVARAFELIEKDKEVKMDRLKKWHKTLLSNCLTVSLIAIFTFIVGYTNLKMGNATMLAIIDTTVLSIVFTTFGILILDIVKKLVEKDDELNFQYVLAFCLAVLSVSGFLVAYVAPTWEITIVSAIIFLLGGGGALFTVRYGFIPSLRTEEEAIQDAIQKMFKECESLTKEQALERFKAEVKYNFKRIEWGSDVDTLKPLFQDGKANPISTNDAIVLNRAADIPMIQKVVKDFELIIGKKPKSEVK